VDPWKVKIATRLTILLVVLTVLVALIVGWFAVDASTRSLYSTLDGQINAVIQSGVGHPDAALSDALNVVQENSYNLTLDVVDPSGAVVQVNSAAFVALKKKPTLANVHATLAKVGVQSNLPGFRLRSIYVGGGDYLVVAGSTNAISQQGRRLALDVALIGFIVALVMLVLARLMMRKDLRTMEHLIGFASAVARGDERGEIPSSAGSRDVRELQAALATMVVALHERIAIEARSVEAMQQFVGDASHELRTPLTVIKGYNELLTNPSINEEQRARAVDRVRREIDRMDLLVADLLLSAEVREAPQHLNTRVELSALVEARVDEFRNDHPEREVRHELASGLAVRGREDLLDRLLVNAFSNIVRHTQRDTAVRVTLRRESSRAVLTVEDAGGGLPEYGVRPQRFRRFDQSRSRETGGSGLGMSIMADIAEGLGGSMSTAKSSLGGLALTFSFALES
jgi:signal transduction histidine kinase